MKKVLSVLLALMMVISIIPMSTITASATQSRTVNFSKLYTLIGNPADDIVAIAKAQLGKTTSELRYTEAWCANFVSDCAILAGQTKAIPQNGGVGDLYRAVLKAGGTEVETGKKGDLVFYICTVCSKPYAHVGIVVDSKYSIEGNVLNKVAQIGKNENFNDGSGHNTSSGKLKRVYVRPNYDENSINTLSIRYDANGGTITDTESKYYLGSSDIIYKTSTGKVFTQEIVDGTTCDSGLYNRTTFGLSKEGYTFVGWGTKSSGGTIYNQNDPMTAKKLCPTIGDGDQTITLYAIWEANELSVYYNANGGEVSLEEFTLNSGLIYKNSGKFVQTWKYNEAKDTGLVNPKSFGLTRTGYTFMGWGTKSSGGTIFDQNDTTLLPTDIKSGIKDGSCSRTLYAIWQAKTYTVQYDANGGNGTMSDSSHTYDTTKALNANAFTRTGYTFLGWSTNSADTVAKYTDKQSVKNLTSSNGGTVTLYAVWSQNEHTAGEWIVVTPATCTTVGLTTLSCTTCGETIAEKEIPVTEHAVGEWEVVEKETCTTDGMRQMKCTACGEVIANEEVSATGHIAGEWEIVAEATCTTEGLKEQKCTVCTDVINTEEIPTTDHTYGEWLTIIEPTCEETGMKVQDCYYCGVELANEIIPATGHVYNSVITPPTCTTQGYTTYTCSCGHSYVGDYVNATGHNDNNGDGYCDTDNELLDPTKNCDCNCHKKGISNFFFKFALFFQKIFGANKTCSCGVAHY